MDITIWTKPVSRMELYGEKTKTAADAADFTNDDGTADLDGLKRSLERL